MKKSRAFCESTPPETPLSQHNWLAPQPPVYFDLTAAAGSVLIGLTLPYLLVLLRLSGKKFGSGEFDAPISDFNALVLLLSAPGAIVLSIILLRNLVPVTVNWTLQRSAIVGMLSGIALAYLNLPAYIAWEFLRGDTYLYARMALLFVVAGASCGLWIGWLAWRAWHPGEHFFPRFSLRTLILIVLLWGGTMLVFQPREWPPSPPFHER